MAQRIAEFFTTESNTQHARVLEIMKELRLLAPRAQNNRYAGPLHDDIVKNLSTATKLAKLLEAVVAGNIEKCQKAAIPTILKQIDACIKQFEEVKQWAQKILPSTEPSKPGRRKRKTADGA